MQTAAEMCVNNQRGVIDRMRMRSSGFTLVEVLLVVAIIAIMAGILFPVFSAARESARKAACLSNEKQLGIAFLTYADDYREILPPSVSFANGKPVPWDTLIMPYVRDVKVFKCPSDTVPRDFNQTPRSYSMNDPIARYLVEVQGAYAWSSRGLKLALLPNPSRYVLLTEWHAEGNILGSTNDQTMYNFPSDYQYYHNQGEGNNFLFFDSHARYYQCGQLNDAQNWHLPNNVVASM